MKLVFVARVAALAAVAGLAFACTDRSELAGPEVVASGRPISSLNDFMVTCTANTVARTVKCGDANNGVRSDLIIGGQGTYVKLTSSNVQVFADTIAFDVDVQNLIGQPIGTTDSLNTPEPTGVRVFFVQAPTPVGGGSISVANPDGISVFTNANQAYFRYASVPFPGESTGSRTWKLQFSPASMTFTFQLGVSAPVEFPHGYIDDIGRVITLNPSEAFLLPGTVRNALGTAQGGQTITWSSSNATAATVAASTVTGGTFGYSVLTGVSNSRPTTGDVYAHTCPYITVSNGTTYVDSVATTDCFTAFHKNEDFLPGDKYRGDLYRVQLQAGQTIDISVDTDGGLDSMLSLMDRMGFYMADNDDDDIGSLGVGSRIQFTATVSGTYVIQVTHFNETDFGPYTLHVSIADPI